MTLFTTTASTTHLEHAVQIDDKHKGKQATSNPRQNWNDIAIVALWQYLVVWLAVVVVEKAASYSPPGSTNGSKHCI